MTDRQKYLLWWLILVAIALLVSIPAQAQWTETGMNDAVGSVTDSSPTVQIHNAGCANGMLYTPLCGRLYSAILADSVQVTVRIDSVAGDGQLFSQSGFLLAVEDTSDATSSVYGLEYLSRGDLRVIDSDESQPVDSVLVGGALVPRIVDLIRLDGASDDTLRWTVTNVAGDTLYQWDDVKTLVDSIYVSLGAASREAGTDSTWIYAKNLTYTEGAAPPLAPASVMLSTPNYEDQLDCSWEWVSGASSYTAELYDTGDPVTPIESLLVNDDGGPAAQDTTYTGLTWGDTFYCTVTSTGGGSAQSSNFTLKQAAPTISSVDVTSATSLTVNWANPFGASIDSNKIYINASLDTTIATNTTFLIEDLTTDVQVAVTVSAKNAGGNSDQSTGENGTPSSAPTVSNVTVADITTATARGSVAFAADITDASGNAWIEMAHVGDLDTYRITDKEDIDGNTINFTPNSQFDPNVMEGAWYFMIVWEPTPGNTSILSPYTGGSSQEGVYAHQRSVVSSDLMLDKLATQPIAAYSLNKLDADYAGSAIKIRDSADGSLHDIGFTDDLFAGISGVIDGDTAYVHTLYDQVGSDDLVNATEATQIYLENPSGQQWQLAQRPSATEAGGLTASSTTLWTAINGNDDLQVYVLAAIPDDAIGNQQYLTQIGRYGPDNTHGFFKIERQGTSSNWEVAIQVTGSPGTRKNADTPADAYAEGTWIVIHAAKDQTPGGFFRSYEDNVQQGTVATALALEDNTGASQPTSHTIFGSHDLDRNDHQYQGSAHTFIYFDEHLVTGDNAIIHGYLNTWKSTLSE